MSTPLPGPVNWKWKALRAAVHVRRHPWLFALLGFVAGIASFLLVDRQQDTAGLIAILMLAGWVWLVLEDPIRRLISLIPGVDLPPPLVRFTTQLIHQESFFFALPFFAITTTWNSVQALFTALIGIAGLISIIDPVYHGWLTRHRWLYLAYHCLALSTILLTALPIILHLSTWESYIITTALTLTLALPSLAQAVPLGGALRLVGMAVVLTVLVATAWFGRVAVPPATLWLTESTISHLVDQDDMEPGRSLEEATAEAVAERGLYAYTAIRAPRGLHETVYHEWVHNGRVYDRIPLEVTGGREAGYRAWTHKLRFPPNPEGIWHVRVRTGSDQMIGQIRFRVRD
ncbi:DUF5924 family protein [uncultured Halovibrio sp.]|uniref:DUF5924 family protein n=1 Tax=uncultured Halovibrio sp. TaxID=985049 RepID=UPI0025F3CEF8|nr:DUF5924 family protein [uncultured Halovibrio sp.]